MDAPSGSRKIQFFSDGHEVSQMPELHGDTIADNYQYRIFNILEYRQSPAESVSTGLPASVSPSTVCWDVERRFMQTLTFLWFELKAAKRHVKEAVAEGQELGKADFSLLKKASDLEVVEQHPPPQRHLSSSRITKKDAGLGSGPCLQGH